MTYKDGHMTLPAILRGYARDFDACGPSHAAMSEHMEAAAKCVEAAEWIASQPMIGPAATWWDMRAKARVALGLPPVALSPEERNK
jgi:hypothetical protein